MNDHFSRTMTVREASEVFRINVKTLYTAIQMGQIPAIRLGRTLRLSGNVVAEALQTGKIPVFSARKG